MAATLFAIWLGYLLPRPELTTVVVLLSSLPIVFTAGFAWPAESLPRWLDVVTLMIPVKPGIQGFLAINQMGAPLLSIGREMCVLLGLCAFYGSWIGWLVHRQRRLAK